MFNNIMPWVKGWGCNHTPKVCVYFIFVCITYYGFAETVSLFALINAN